MTLKADNCLICAQEHLAIELASFGAQANGFRICLSCLSSSDPAEDYREVHNIVLAFLEMDERLKQQ